MPIPEVHTDFPLAALGEELGLDRRPGDPGPVPRARGARPADRGGRRGRLPGAARGRPRAGHRHPGVHHRGGQPQGAAADRRHAAVHQLRRLVASSRTRSSSGCCSPSPTRASSRRRVADRTRSLAAPPPAGARLMSGLVSARRPLGRSDRPASPSRCRWRSRRSPLAVGYWGVVQAPELTRRRTTPRSSRPRGPCRAAGSSIATADSSPSTRRTRTASSIASTPDRRIARSSATPRRATAGPASSARSTPSSPGWPAIRCATRSASSGPTRSTPRT